MHDEQIKKLKSKGLPNKIYLIALEYIHKGYDVDFAVAKAKEEIEQKKLQKQRRSFSR